MANKVSIESKFNMNSVLPTNLVIKGADSHLFRIGLSLYESRTKIKRKWYSSPILIWSYITVSLIKHLYLLLVDSGDADYRFIIGDCDYFMKSIRFLNYVVIICDVINLCSQLINVYNKRNDIKPDLRVFEMMAGFISPESIGLKDKESVVKLIKFAKKGLKQAKKTNNYTGN